MKKIIITAVSLITVLSFTACNKKEKVDTPTPEPTAKATEQATVKPVVNLGVSDEEMGDIVDKAEDGYKSFEIIPVDTPDFFEGKKLRLAAMVSDHNMSMLYNANAQTEISNDKLVMDVPNESGEVTKNEFIVYTMADEVKKSPNGEDFSYIAYGSDEITSEQTEGAIGIMCLVKLRDDIDMGEAAADSYVMLVETSNPDIYYMFKAE